MYVFNINAFAQNVHNAKRLYLFGYLTGNGGLQTFALVFFQFIFLGCIEKRPQAARVNRQFFVHIARQSPIKLRGVRRLTVHIGVSALLAATANKGFLYQGFKGLFVDIGGIHNALCFLTLLE